MQKISFDSDWRFRKHTHSFEPPKDDGIPVTLPHDAQIAEPRSAEHETGTGGGYFRGGSYVYTKRFTPPAAWLEGQVALELEGVYQWAEVSLGGDLLANQPYGYSSFLVDLTGRLRAGEENVLQVFANNSAVPNSRWYSGAGMYRHAWIRTGGAVSVKPWGLRVKTPAVGPARSVAEIVAELENIGGAEQAVTVAVTATGPDGKAFRAEARAVVPAGGSAQADVRLEIAPAALWSVEEPNLYTLEAVVTAEGAECDRALVTFGVRKVEVDAKNGFRLNGLPMKIKGGCVHHDNGLLGSASFDRAEERKVELLKKAGYTMIRCAHNPPAPAMLEACDRLGLMVMDETFDCWRMGKNPNDYHLFFEDWWERDTRAMVARDFNHPSIVMWSVGNEIGERDGSSDGAAWCARQADLVRSLDDTRPVSSALCGIDGDPVRTTESDCGFTNLYLSMTGAKVLENDLLGDKTAPYAAALDVVGYNYMIHRYAHDGKKFPNRVIAGTETFPAQQFEYWMATLENQNVIGDFVWTALDYLGEAGIGIAGYAENGPLDNTYPWHQAFCGDFDLCGFKRPQSYFRDILWGVRDIPYIATHHPDNFGKTVAMSPWGWSPVAECWDYPGAEGKKITVEVYSDNDEVELFLNGVSFGKKPAGKAQRNTALFEIDYLPGVLTAAAYRGGKETGRFSLQSAGKAARLRLTPDRSQIHADCGDLCYLTAEVLDNDGKLVACAENPVTVTVSGVGVLQAAGNGNPRSEEAYTGPVRAAFQGRLMAVVKSVGEAGAITVRAEAPGLLAAEVTLEATS